MLEIVDYRSSWSDEFRELAARLSSALGPLALRIDHIGSTAVPGLAAKDVIDVQITVAALDDAVLRALESLGYVHVARITADHRPASFEKSPEEHGDDGWRKWFFRAPPGVRPTNTHVRIAGRANQRYPLLFREYLRTHPATTAAYAELKSRLAAELLDPETYPDVKDPAVDLIYLAAEEWAAQVGWSIDRDLDASGPFGPMRELCRCDQLQRMTDEPASPVEFDARTNEYHLERRNGDGYELLFFCPFCGGQAPPSRREGLFHRISQAERDRFGELFGKFKTLDDVLAAFGRPDWECELFSASTTTERDGGPETTRYRRQWTYRNLSETAVINVCFSQPDELEFSIYGKQLPA